jgi:hypothetical protein
MTKRATRRSRGLSSRVFRPLKTTVNEVHNLAGKTFKAAANLGKAVISSSSKITKNVGKSFTNNGSAKRRRKSTRKRKN